MVSYFKTQWWRLLIAFFCLVMTLVYVCKPCPDTMTIEGLNAVLSDIVTAGFYFIGFIVWAFMSVVEYNNDRIELLEKKAEKYDAMYELVQELREANKIDRELDAVQDQRIKRLEDKLYDLRRKLYSDVD